MTFRVVETNNHIAGLTWVTIVNTPPDQKHFPKDPSWTLCISPNLGGWISYYWEESAGATDTPDLTEEFLALLSDEQKAEAVADAMRNRSNT